MALAIDAQSSAQQGANVSSLSWTHTPVGTPTAAAVRFYGFDCQKITGITYGGVAMALSVSTTDATGDTCAIWSLLAPPSGAQSVVMTFSGGAYPIANSVTVTGGDASSVFSNTASNNGTGTALSVTCTSAAGEIVIGMFGQDPSTSLTIGGSAAEDFNTVNSGEYGAGSQQAGAASVALAYTGGLTTPWAAVAASFKAAAASADNPYYYRNIAGHGG